MARVVAEVAALLLMAPLGYGAGALLGAGRAPAPQDAPSPPRAVRSPPPSPAPPPPPLEVVDTGDDALAACRSQLAACRALARVQRIQAIGAPRPWTDAVPEAHRPPAVRQAVEQVEEQCGVARTVVDCAEHPCIVYVPAEVSLADCPAWPYDAPLSGGASPDPDDVDLRIHYVLEPGEQHPLGDPDWRPRLEHRLESNRGWVEDRFREGTP